MKKIYRFVMLAVAVIMPFSCEKVQEAIENEETVIEKTVTFVAEPIMETKTIFGDLSGSKFPTLWTDTQQVEISLNYNAPKDATVVPSANQKTASLQANFTDDSSGAYTFYALSPKAAYQNSITTNQWGFAIPITQNPVVGSVDETAMILAAKSTTEGTFPTSPINLSFTHVTAYACMTLTNLVDLSEVTINSIAITAEDNIAGRWYYHPDSNTVEEWSASSTITVKTASTSNIWFALAPVDLAGKSFKVVVNTTGGTVTKQITWPSGKVFTAGHVAKFNINMSGCPLVTPKVYNLVKDDDDLTNNSKVLIVNLDGDKAISTTQNTNNRAAAGVTMSDDKITDPSDGVEVFTVKDGTQDGTLAFLATTEAGYIYAASSGSNYLRTQAENNDNGSFLVTVDPSTGEATAIAQGSNTRNNLKYNSGSDVFSCYGSGQTSIAFYKLDGSGDPVLPKAATPTFSPAAGEVTAGTEVTISCATEGATIHYTTDGSTPTGESATYSSPIEVSAAMTIKAIAIKDSYKNSNVAEAAYTIAGSYDFETIAELNALASPGGSKSGILTSAVVSYVPDANNAIIKDATGSILLYKTGHGLLQGQTFTGSLSVTITTYNSCSELTACDASFSGETTSVDPADVTLAQLSGNLSTYQNAYVRVNNLIVTAVSGKNVTVTDVGGAHSYVVYSNAGNATCAVGDVISVVGTIAHYGANDQVKAWATEDITVTGHTIRYSQPTGAAATAGCSFTVTKTSGEDSITSGDIVASGTGITLTATAGTDYEFTSWTVSGAFVAEASESPTTFTMGDASVSISANFTYTGGGVVTKDYYKLVTSLEDITAGTYVVGALRSTTATNNFYFGKATVNSGDWVVSDGYVTVADVEGVRRFETKDLPSGAVEFTFTGDNTDGFTISNSTNYLYFTAASNRKLAFAAEGATQKWKVASKAEPLITGGITLSAVGGTNYTISENSTGTGAIRGYANTTQYRAIYLFKKVTE